jgi:hypothetical protein
LFHPFDFGFEQILANFCVFQRQADRAWRQMRISATNIAQGFLPRQKKSRFTQHLALQLSQGYNAVTKSSIINGIRSFAREASTAGDGVMPVKPVSLSPFSGATLP